MPQARASWQIVLSRRSKKTATVTPTPSPEPEKQEPATGSEASQADYILNTNTKKFHYPTCSSVNDMKEKNKQEFFGTRDEAISNGYSPCGRSQALTGRPNRKSYFLLSVVKRLWIT